MQRPAHRRVSGSGGAAEGSFAAAPPALRSSFGSWWTQNVASSATVPTQQGATGYPTVSGATALTSSGLAQGDQAAQQGPRLSSSLSSSLGIHDSAASAGGSAHGVAQGRESGGGAPDLRDSNQGAPSLSAGVLRAASGSQGGAPTMRASVDQSDTSSVSSVSVSGAAATPGSMSGFDQSGMPAAAAGSSSSLGGLSGTASGAVSTPGPAWEGGAGAAAVSSSYPTPGFLANWSSGGGTGASSGVGSGSGGASGIAGIAGLNLSSYYASRPAATGLLSGHRGSAAALREEAAWLAGAGGIGCNSPRPTREPPSPALRGLVTRPELALCLLTEVRIFRARLMDLVGRAVRFACDYAVCIWHGCHLQAAQSLCHTLGL